RLLEEDHRFFPPIHSIHSIKCPVLNSETLKELHHAGKFLNFTFVVTASRKKLKSPSIDYWEREPGSWGSVSDWDIYYINNVPGVSKAQAHSSLGLELDIILKALPLKSRAYYKAEDLNKSLKNSKKDQVNQELWQQYSTKKGKLAVENRIHRFEILTTGIRAATGAVRAEFPPLKRKLNKPHSPDINDGDEKLTKKVRAEDEDQETIDYGRIYRISSAEDELARGIEKKDTAKLIDILRKQDNLFLNEKHFNILQNQEIVGRDFIKMDKQDFKECGLETGPSMRLAEFARMLNNKNENLCKTSTVETSSAITEFDLNKFRKEFIEDLSGILGDELQNIKRDMEKIKCQKKW
ncbi:1666_t:CDS:2, partial [Funneliformis caledonium]